MARKNKNKRARVKQNSEHQKNNQYINKSERERIAQEQAAAAKEAKLPPKIDPETVEIPAKGLNHKAAVLTLTDANEQEMRNSLSSFYRSTLPEGAEFDQDACDRFVNENMAMPVNEETGIGVNTYMIDDRLVFVTKGDLRTADGSGIDKAAFIRAVKPSVAAFEKANPGSLAKCYSNAKYSQPINPAPENEPVKEEPKPVEEQPVNDGQNPVGEQPVEEQPVEEQPAAEPQYLFNLEDMIGENLISAKALVLDPSWSAEQKAEALTDFYYSLTPKDVEVSQDVLDRFILDADNLAPVNGTDVGIGAQMIGDTYALVMTGDVYKDAGKTELDFMKVSETVHDRLEVLHATHLEEQAAKEPKYLFHVDDMVGNEPVAAEALVIDPTWSAEQKAEALTAFYYSMSPKDAVVTQTELDQFVYDAEHLIPVEGLNGGVGAQKIGDTYALVMTGDVYKDAGKTELDFMKVSETVHDRLEVLHALNSKETVQETAKEPQSVTATTAGPRQNFTIHPEIAGERVNAHVFVMNPDLSKEAQTQALADFYVSMVPEDQNISIDELQMFVDNANNLSPIEGLDARVGAQMIGNNYALVMSGNVYKDEAKTKLDNVKLKDVVHERLDALNAVNVAEQATAQPSAQSTPATPGAPRQNFTIHPEIAGERVNAHVFVMNPDLSKEAQTQALADFYVSMVPENQNISIDELQMFVDNANNLSPIEGLDARVGAQMIGNNYALVMSGNVYKDETKTKLDNVKLKDVVHERLETLHALSAEEKSARGPVHHFTVDTIVGNNEKIAAKALVLDPNWSDAEKENALTDFYYSLTPKDQTVPQEELDGFIVGANTLSHVEGTNIGVGAQMIGDTYALVMEGSVYKDASKTQIDKELIDDLVQERLEALHAKKLEEEKKKKTVKTEITVEKEQNLQEDVEKAGNKLKKSPFPKGLDFEFDGRKYHATLCPLLGQTPEAQRKELEDFYRKEHGNEPVNEKKLDSFLNTADGLKVKDGEKTAVIAIRDGDKIHVLVKGDFYKRVDGAIAGYDTDLLKKLAEKSIKELRERELAQEEAEKSKQPPDNEPENYKDLPEQKVFQDQLKDDLEKDEKALEDREKSLSPAKEKVVEEKKEIEPVQQQV